MSKDTYKSGFEISPLPSPPMPCAWRFVHLRLTSKRARYDRPATQLKYLLGPLGTTLEFRAPDTFKPITEMIGGGPFGLEPGQWTDDTAMALCLAESLIEKRGFDPKDQMDRYCR